MINGRVTLCMHQHDTRQMQNVSLYLSNYAIGCLSVLFLPFKFSQATYPCSDGAHYQSNRKMPPKLCFAGQVLLSIVQGLVSIWRAWRIAHARKIARSCVVIIMHKEPRLFLSDIYHHRRPRLWMSVNGVWYRAIYKTLYRVFQFHRFHCK